MRRKSLLLALVILLVLVSGAGAAVALLARHEPAFYRNAAAAPGHQRRKLSNDFLIEFSQLTSAFLSEEPNWMARFDTEQINSYLQEGFLASGLDRQMLPEDVSDPRVTISTDRVRLGFRYGTGRWSTIVSIDLRPWVAKGEANTVVLELLALHAGALPISAQSLLEHMTEALRQSRNNLEVSWYRHDGHPVALLRFTSSQPRTSVLLQGVDLQPDKLVLRGTCLNGSTPATADAAKPAGN
jgi:hypothetical protein